MEELDTRLIVESALVHSGRQHAVALEIINRGRTEAKAGPETSALLRELSLPDDEPT
jgi:hypothetical protein